MTMIQASEIETGATFHDGSLIQVIAQTAAFITVRLSNGAEMCGQSIERKWKKTSMIEVI
jgi:hypothetical protein